ncbi:MAG: SoxR reducing system RseC family protein [Paludibacteraceae bacterium]
MSAEIEHTGVISSVETGKLHVRILQQSACSACHAKSACTTIDSQNREVIVENVDGNFQLGETVKLYGKTSDGLLAVLLVFIIPFVLILLSLFFFRYTFENEVFTALVSLLMLVPYYFVLSRLNKKFSKKFYFFVEKIHNTSPPTS